MMASNSTSRSSHPPQVWEGFIDEIFIIALLVGFAPAKQRIKGVINCFIIVIVSLLRLFVRGAPPLHPSICLAGLSHLKLTPRHPNLWWGLTVLVYILDTLYTEIAMALCHGLICKYLLIGGTVLYLMAALTFLLAAKNQLPNNCQRAVVNLGLQFALMALWVIAKKAIDGTSLYCAIFYLGYLIGTTTPFKFIKTRFSFKPTQELTSYVNPINGAGNN